MIRARAKTPRRHSWWSASGIALSMLLFIGVGAAGIGQVHAATLSTKIYISICGDGITEQGEVCDDGAGNNTGGYGPTAGSRHCNADCGSYGPYCGDGVLQVRFTEECDQGGANGGGGLCSATCRSLPPAPPSGTPTTGSPAVGSIPTVSGATPGSISAANQTEVVLRGKAYPNSTVHILLDGQALGAVQADSNADFLYTNTTVTPGTATFSFSATDSGGITSLTDSVVFEIGHWS